MIELPLPIPFDDFKDLLEDERKAVIKAHGFSSDDFETMLRSTDEAQRVLSFIQKIQTSLYSFFEEYPSLMSLFEKEYCFIKDFFGRNFILNLCFLDDYLIPEKNLFPFIHEGELSENLLKQHSDFWNLWIEEKKEKHFATQESLKKNSFDQNLSESLDCACVACLGDLRTKLRENLLKECLSLIEQTEIQVNESLKNNDFSSSGRFFGDMQREIEKKIRKLRYRLRRSTLSKIDTQVKRKIKEIFGHSSPLESLRKEMVKPFLRDYLRKEGLSEDLIEPEEWEKFLKHLGLSIWRNEYYLLREFKKFIRSLMVLKKKDISGKILKEYIGEFWLHSQARTIKRKIVYHMGPTNSGKTYYAIKKLVTAKKGCYLAPLRLLAAELFDTLNHQGVKTTLLTGEEVIEKEGATHYASTIEMARLQEYFDCCVIDEIQMITDRQRGWAWTRALVNIFADEVHICGDSSVLKLIEEIVELCGDELEIKHYDRMTKLKVEKKPIIVGGLKPSDALIVFSRRNALRYKRDLERLGLKVSIVYGRLSPEVRREQARKFDTGETDIMVSTDAIAMGMNLPIRRIVFSTLSKYIDSTEYPISDSEIKQIAGRAGRFKRFETGFVTCLSKCEEGLEKIEKALNVELKQQMKCMVGADLDIYTQVNKALEDHGLSILKLSEFLRLFNTMNFKKPFHCVDLKEMIELTEMVEDADTQEKLKPFEVFGFSCAPVNLSLMDHVQYYVWILKHYIADKPIYNDGVDPQSNDIDYLETSIKCVELYQWLSRHFNNKNFSYDEIQLLTNKAEAVDKLNTLLSDKIVLTCSSCGVKMQENSRFNICEECFKKRHSHRRRRKKLQPASSSRLKGRTQASSRKNSFQRRKKSR